MENEAAAFKIGHVLIQVDDVEAASKSYRAKGFTVKPGGLPGKAYNALVFFEDGSFLELFSTEHGPLANALMKAAVGVMGLFDRAYAARLKRYLPGKEGLCDFALDSLGVGRFMENVSAAQGRGLSFARKRSQARVDRLGVRHAWEISAPADVALPFLMSAYTPPLQVGEADAAHENGARGIHALCCTTARWEEVYYGYEQLLGVSPDVVGSKGRRSCVFPIAQAELRLSEGEKDGLVQLVLRGAAAEAPRSLEEYIELRSGATKGGGNGRVRACERMHPGG